MLEVQCMKGPFHAAFTPSSTIVLALGVYAAKLGKLEVLNIMWTRHLQLRTKFQQLSDGKVVIGLRGNGMRKLLKAGAEALRETPADDDEMAAFSEGAEVPRADLGFDDEDSEREGEEEETIEPPLQQTMEEEEEEAEAEAQQAEELLEEINLGTTSRKKPAPLEIKKLAAITMGSHEFT